MPALSVLGATDEPGEISGRSPIDPDTARRLATSGACTGWDRVITHPVSGAVLSVDRYTPSAELKRFVWARDRRCRFPGCRMPARRCDVDHTRDHAKGGTTERCNLACLCKRHHTLTHATAWHVAQRADGVLIWTSPTGRVYSDRPEPAVTFVPDAGPPGDPAPF